MSSVLNTANTLKVTRSILSYDNLTSVQNTESFVITVPYTLDDCL